MTIFGPDISSYEAGVDVSKLPDPFILMKVTEGTYYIDSQYAKWLTQAKTSGKLAIAYHFVRADEAPASQAAWIAAHILDKNLPLMLDVETEGGSKPSFQQVLNLVSACHQEGLRPKLLYLPRWYWEGIGSPSMTVLAGLGIGLISSAYPGGSAYPGDNAAGWAAYGGATPLLYQFTDSETDAGQHVGDYNAFKGTAEQFREFLYNMPPSVPQALGEIMANIPSAIGQKWPEIAGEFPANGPYDDSGAIIWADGGARAAAFYAKQARDEANVINALVGTLNASVNALAAKITAPDLTALADAIVTEITPHLTVGVDITAIADAVQQRLATALSKG